MKNLLAIAAFSLFFTNVLLAQEEEVQTKKSKLLPDYFKLQYAGGIGFMSAGLGYEIFRKKNGELDLFFGYMPQPVGGDEISTIAVKFQYMPWKINLIKKRKYELEPIFFGVLAYHAFSDDLNRAADKNLYPDNYYEWMVRSRVGPILGSRLIKNFSEESLIKSITFYWELGTNDLYLYSWVGNRTTVPFTRIWNSSFGLKCVF